MNEILDRDIIAKEIKQILSDFDKNCRNLSFKKGIYIYGSPGCGKSHFVVNLLKEMNYDIIKYDAGDVRNKALIDTINCNNISNQNVLSMMNGKIKKIAIVMDEIDGMNNGDKGGITSLIKLIRQKKTKKQKMENITLNPIICIGNYYVDKKIKELMKVCNVFELKTVTDGEILKLLKVNNNNNNNNIPLYEKLVNYIQGDLRKLSFVKKILLKKPEILSCPLVLDNILHIKSHNDDSKTITKLILNNKMSIVNHNQFMNENDRTIVALLYHENFVDLLFSNHMITNENKFLFYSKFLENVCFADYIDRITFQNQIWVFNEMTSLIKTFYNNHLYHNAFHKYHSSNIIQEVRFTKVLTKFSTEYNNQIFVYNLCQKLEMDKKDLISFFQEIRLSHREYFTNTNNNNNNNTNDIVDKLFQETDITPLDIKRMYRFLDKNAKQENINENIENENDNEVDD